MLKVWPNGFSLYAKALPKGVYVVIAADLMASTPYLINGTRAVVWAEIAALGLCPYFGFQIAPVFSGGQTGPLLKPAIPQNAPFWKRCWSWLPNATGDWHTDESRGVGSAAK